MFAPLEQSPRSTLPPMPSAFTTHVRSVDVELGSYALQLGMSDDVDWDKVVAAFEPLPLARRLQEDDTVTLMLPAGLGQKYFGPDPNPWEGLPLAPGIFTGELYAENPNQQAVVSNTLDALRSRRYATMESPVGSGKTVMVVSIVCQLGRRALFVTTTTNLLEQARTQGFMAFAPHLKVGQLRGRRYSAVEDCDIVLCCPRTLLADHDPAWFKRFGTLVFDEAHKAATSEMLEAGRRLRCKYRLGVSATLRRNDDKYIFIPAILGDVATRLTRVWSGVTYVTHFLDYPSKPKAEFPLVSVKWGKYKGRADFQRYGNDIAMHDGRNSAVCDAVQGDLVDRGKIFVYATLVDHLERLQMMLDGRGIEAGLLCMKTNKGDKLKENLARRVILSTYGSGVEGVNDPDVDTVYFVTPFSSASTCRVEQCIGRCRPGPGKPVPLIRDFVDKCSLGFAMHRKRKTAANKLAARHTQTRTHIAG